MKRVLSVIEMGYPYCSEIVGYVLGEEKEEKIVTREEAIKVLKEEGINTDPFEMISDATKRYDLLAVELPELPKSGNFLERYKKYTPDIEKGFEKILKEEEEEEECSKSN